jgi:hypothetical protein
VPCVRPSHEARGRHTGLWGNNRGCLLDYQAGLHGSVDRFWLSESVTAALLFEVPMPAVSMGPTHDS